MKELIGAQRVLIIRAVAASVALVGLLYFLADDKTYRVPQWYWAFRYVSRTQWGLIFMIGGVGTIVLAERMIGRIIGALLTFALIIYAMLLAASVITNRAPLGAAWVWPLTLACLLILSRPDRFRT